MTTILTCGYRWEKVEADSPSGIWANQCVGQWENGRVTSYKSDNRVLYTPNDDKPGWFYGLRMHLRNKGLWPYETTELTNQGA